MDIISTLPQPIIESILSLLPTKEAARTSILSREWRYKWTTLSTLEFPDSKLHVPNRKTNRCTYFNCIHQVLLSHQCPIHELYLEICHGCHRFEFDKLMLHLAKDHTVKTLEISGRYTRTPPVFDFFTSVFSLHHLTYLCITDVKLEDHTIVNVSGSIRSLALDEVLISIQSLLLLLSNCPSLNNLYLQIDETDAGERCTIVDLFKCLPLIKNLTICSISLLYLLDVVLVPQELSSLLFHLKYFCLESTRFDDGYCLPFLSVLIKCAPNLEKIKVEVADDEEQFPVVWEEYSDVWLESLIELKIEYLRNSKLKMEFVKFILARSPKLKKLSIKVRENGDSEKEKSKMLEVLLQAPRASSLVQIIYV